MRMGYGQHVDYGTNLAINDCKRGNRWSKNLRRPWTQA